VDSVKNMISVRAQAMKQLEKTPDSLWEWARAFLQFTMGQYCKDQPEFAADPDLGHLFRRESLSSLCGSACLDLLTILGMGMRWDMIVGYPPQLQPIEWRNKVMRTIIEPWLEPLGLVGPDGRPFLELRTKVKIVPQEDNTELNLRSIVRMK
jgi:hypothetical protein